MNILGNNIIFRALQEDDNKNLFTLLNDPDTEKMIGGFSFPISYEHQLNWFKSLPESNTILRCAIVSKQEPQKFMGTIILTDIDYKNGTAEIHIKLTKNERGKGYGTDAVNTMVRYAFDELRLNCIYSQVLEYNKTSQNLFEKCNFQQEGLLKNRVYKNGKYISIYSYSILKNKD